MELPKLQATASEFREYMTYKRGTSKRHCCCDYCCKEIKVNDNVYAVSFSVTANDYYEWESEYITEGKHLNWCKLEDN